MSKVKNPQDKKRLSYSRDRRNVFGENDKASRNSIRKRKRYGIHSERSKANKIKQLNYNIYNEDYAGDIENRVLEESEKKRLDKFKKYPDMALGEFIGLQRRKRENRYGRKVRAKLRRKNSL